MFKRETKQNFLLNDIGLELKHKHIAANAKISPNKLWFYINGKTRMKSDIPYLVNGILHDGF